MLLISCCLSSFISLVWILPRQQSHIFNCLFDWCAWLDKHIQVWHIQNWPLCCSTYGLNLGKWLFHSSTFSGKTNTFGLSLYSCLYCVPNNAGFIFKTSKIWQFLICFPLSSKSSHHCHVDYWGSLLTSLPAFILASIQFILNKGPSIILYNNPM